MYNWHSPYQLLHWENLLRAETKSGPWAWPSNQPWFSAERQVDSESHVVPVVPQVCVCQAHQVLELILTRSWHSQVCLKETRSSIRSWENFVPVTLRNTVVQAVQTGQPCNRVRPGKEQAWASAHSTQNCAAGTPRSLASQWGQGRAVTDGDRLVDSAYGTPLSFLRNTQQRFHKGLEFLVNL